MRARRPHAVVIVSADHGEEFGDHGGRYHGTTVYEEQVRVPLVIVGARAAGRRAPDASRCRPSICCRRCSARSTSRGRRASAGATSARCLTGKRRRGRRVRLRRDRGAGAPRRRGRCAWSARGGSAPASSSTSPRIPQQQTRRVERSPRPLPRAFAIGCASSRRHTGATSVRGLRAEGKGWPAPILRGASGDGDAAEEIAALLDDADLGIRRKAAELLFELARPRDGARAAARARPRRGRRRAPLVRRSALTRLGQGAPLVYELLDDPELRWRRLAALALAEAGDKRGAGTLIAWWQDAAARDYVRSRQLLSALAVLKQRDSIWPLVPIARATCGCGLTSRNAGRDRRRGGARPARQGARSASATRARAWRSFRRWCASVPSTSWPSRWCASSACPIRFPRAWPPPATRRSSSTSAARTERSAMPPAQEPEPRRCARALRAPRAATAGG